MKRAVVVLFAIAAIFALFAFAFGCGHEHDFKLESETPPTCTEKGERIYACECGKVKTETVKATGHVETVTETTPSTCVTHGSATVRCKKCGTVIAVFNETLPYSSHVFEFESETPPTCTEPGKRIERCKNCPAINETPIAPIGHDVSPDWTEDTPPTFNTNGEKSHHCTRPGCEYRTDVTEIPMLRTQYSITFFRITGEQITNNKCFAHIVVTDEEGSVVENGNIYSTKFNQVLPTGTYKVTVDVSGKGYGLDKNDAGVNKREFYLTPDNPDLEVTVYTHIITDAERSNGLIYTSDDVIYDETLVVVGTTQSEDRKITLSGLMDTHKAVVIYFFDYKNPSAPSALNQAYRSKNSQGNYKDQVAVIMVAKGVNAAGNALDSLREFVSKNELETDVAYFPKPSNFNGAVFFGLENPFRVSSYPTVVSIDKGGMVVDKESMLTVLGITQIFDNVIGIYDKYYSDGDAKETSVNGEPREYATAPKRKDSV